jgi:deazaflavin-dependent oxidoreductase (nitroreductase family)
MGMSDFNTQVIEEFRANRGIVGGHFEGAHVALVHTVGRRSGNKVIKPLLYLPHGDAMVLVGSAGGAQKDPLWVRNLEEMDQVTVEVGERVVTTRPTVLRDGPERDELYPKYVQYWPDLLQYQKNTDRLFPLVRLDPVD